MAFRQSYPQDHASHFPILIGLGHALPIRRIVELGCGEYSTLLFLNRDIFPSVEWVISYENDRSWRTKILEMSGRDPRLGIVPGEWVPNNYDADLVFIDNGPYEERENAILQVVCSDYNGIVAVHDSEVEAYKLPLERLRHRWDFKAFEPNTTVGTNGDGLPLAYIQEAISGRENYAVSDVPGWKKIYQERHV